MPISCAIGASVRAVLYIIFDGAVKLRLRLE